MNTYGSLQLLNACSVKKFESGTERLWFLLNGVGDMGQQDARWLQGMSCNRDYRSNPTIMSLVRYKQGSLTSKLLWIRVSA